MAGLPWFKQQVDLRRDPRSLILGDILGDPRAWTYVVEMRMYLAENAPTGCVSGMRADVALERGSGWTGERGRLISAMREAGFIRAGAARDGEGIEVEDVDWQREQGAHVAKFARDAKKPDGRAHKVVNPSRDIDGSRSDPSQLPSGESRELRVESREERKDLPPSAGAAAGPEQAGPPGSDAPTSPADTASATEAIQKGLPWDKPPAATTPKPADLQALWNAKAHSGMSRWEAMGTKRRKAAGARLEEHPDLEWWEKVIERMNASPFLRGEKGDWKASPDFLLQPDAAGKVLEGKYDPPSATQRTRQQEIWEGLQERRRSALEAVGQTCAPELATADYINTALARWKDTKKGEDNDSLDAMGAAFIHFCEDPRYLEKGLPLKLFLSPGVFAECEAKDQAHLFYIADLRAPGIR